MNKYKEIILLTGKYEAGMLNACHVIQGDFATHAEPDAQKSNLSVFIKAATWSIKIEQSALLYLKWSILYINQMSINMLHALKCSMAYCCAIKVVKAFWKYETELLYAQAIYLSCQILYIIKKKMSDALKYVGRRSMTVK